MLAEDRALLDLDLCVVVPQLAREVREQIHTVAWEIGFDHGRLLAPVIFSQAEFSDGPMSASTLVANIRRDGIAARPSRRNSKS